MSIFFGDLETYNEVDLKTAGTARYAETAEITLFAWAVDDGPVRVHDFTHDPRIPVQLQADMDAAEQVVFHNSWFDRNVLMRQKPSLCPPIGRWFDTMVQAFAHGLPGSLDKLGEIFNIAEDKRKLKEGRELVMLFCKPRPKGMALRRATRVTHPEKWAKFVEYAGNDIESMRILYRRMPKWNYPRERALWELDQRINERGFNVDQDLARAAVAACADEKLVLAEKAQEMTLGMVDSATKRDQLLAFLLAAYGVDLPDMKKDTLQRRIADETLPQAVRDLLEVRLEATTTSTAKYKTLMRTVSSDGRLRGTHQFCGAMRTGRWAHRMFQPGNLPRPTHKQWEIDQGIEALKLGGIDLVTDSVMKLCSSAIRGAIVATPGKKLVVADLANIEGRGIAWLAGEQWKLQAFRDYDAGDGPDLYAVAYAKAFSITPEEVMENKEHGDGSMRQIGKVMELMLGYGGGVGAFLTGAATYGIDLDDMADKAWASIPESVKDEARGFLSWLYGKNKKTNPVYWQSKGFSADEARAAAEGERLKVRFGLTEKAFVACDSLKRLWRATHPEISSWWKELEDTARTAIANPGQSLTCRSVIFCRTGAWLRIILPSGRSLCYPSPRVDEDGQISYMGVNQYNRQWCRIKSYGGKFAENITQAFARDVLAENMPAVEAAGYDILLLVHDEDVTEAPDTDDYNVEHLASLISRQPAWAPDIPLAAAGFEGYRYRKD